MPRARSQRFEILSQVAYIGERYAIETRERDRRGLPRVLALFSIVVLLHEFLDRVRVVCVSPPPNSRGMGVVGGPGPDFLPEFCHTWVLSTSGTQKNG